MQRYCVPSAYSQLAPLPEQLLFRSLFTKSCAANEVEDHFQEACWHDATPAAINLAIVPTVWICCDGKVTKEERCTSCTLIIAHHLDRKVF